jgi:hemerythrin-like domain-containing protein
MVAVMTPVGPLMKEHRLIEKAVRLLGESYDQMLETCGNGTELGTSFVGFFRTYAHRLILIHNELVRLYARHASTEDECLFVPVMEYFSPEEQQTILDARKEFDENLVGEIHYERVRNMENRLAMRSLLRTNR